MSSHASDEDPATWEDADEQIESEPALCLLCPAVLPSVEVALAHLAGSHDCNIRALRATLGLERELRV